MIECYGWINISSNDVSLDMITLIEKSFAANDGLNRALTGQYMNGNYRASILIAANHSSSCEWVSRLYESIALKSNTSYGLVTIRDDEDKNGFDNEFQTWVLKRGSFVQEKDTHLSPCMPVIEDMP